MFMLKNLKTGQLVPASYNRYTGFKKSYLRLINYLDFHFKKWFRCMVTLTFADATNVINLKDRRRVLAYIKRELASKGSGFLYIAANEIQIERMETYGEVSAHLHIVCCYTVSKAFPFAGDIEKVWGLGIVDVAPPRKAQHPISTFKYLGKYLTKQDVGGLHAKRARLYESSRVRALYNLKPDLIRELLVYYPLSLLERCYWESNSLVLYPDGEREVLLALPRSDWVVAR